VANVVVRMAVVVRSRCKMLAVTGLGLGECVDRGVCWDVVSVGGGGNA